jgi:small-conductance mechanosensitive channel
MDQTNMNGIAAGVHPLPAPLIHLPHWIDDSYLPYVQIALVVVAAPAIYYLMLQLGRRLKRRHGVRLGVTYHLFAFGFGVFLPAVLLRPDWPVTHHIGAFTVIFGAVFVISLVDRYIWELYFKQLNNIDVPKFLPEVARMGILLLGVFIAMEDFYRQTIQGIALYVGPGIAALVLGFAMQDSLGNIISGITLQAGRPYSHGDWLQVDGRYAEVIEVNWRATRLRTLDDVVIEIPHRQMASQTIVNLNRPTRRHAMRISIGLDYSAPPSRVKDVLLHATNNAKGVAPEPKPKVYLKNFGDSSIEYEIKFWLDNHLYYYDVCDSIRTNVWYSLQRHGIKIPFPTRTLQIERPSRTHEEQVHSTARLILRQQPMFKSFTDEQLDALLPRGQISKFGGGEKVIEQGANGDSMFILVKGEANVVISRNGNESLVASLSSGDCFGEMSLLTGEKRSASVIAHTDCEVVEIGKPILANSLKENPELVTKLSELLARRQMENDGTFAALSDTGILRAKQSEYQTTFFAKLKTFFEI